jgi:hypothetical protein
MVLLYNGEINAKVFRMFKDSALSDGRIAMTSVAFHPQSGITFRASQM